MMWTCDGCTGDHMCKDIVGVYRHIRRYHQLILENEQVDRTNEVYTG